MKQKDAISLQVPQEMKAALEAKAKSEELNLSQFCRRILKQHLEAATPSMRRSRPSILPTRHMPLTALRKVSDEAYKAPVEHVEEAA